MAQREELGWFARFALIRREERAACAWAALYFFFILASTFALRPVREQTGVKEGTANLPWLFTGTCVAMVLVHPLYSWLVAKFPRRLFLPLFYQFFGFTLLVFGALYQWTSSEKGSPLNWVFFVWFSVFNVFAIAVLRGYLADVFSPAAAKRVFGVIGVGGTLGAMAGAKFNEVFADDIPRPAFFLCSFVLLELAVFAMTRVAHAARSLQRESAEAQHEVRVEGSLASSVKLAFGSPYLLGMSAVMLLSAMTFTMFYVEQAVIVGQRYADPALTQAQRDALQQADLARIDFWTQTLTFVLELFLTGRVLSRLGTPVALVALPTVAVIGFSWLAVSPTFAVLACVQVAMRGTNYGLASPARDVLYTPLSREVKYRVKSLIETFVWRVGDLLGVWVKPTVQSLGGGLAGVAVTIGILWAAIALWLGRTHERKEREAAERRNLTAA
ncbi:MAG: MFS transporter [Planctomycetes bacterium]|nr:MFS transporter [Planctomycetota bacterium]